MKLRPERQDYAPPFHTYIRLVPTGDLLEILTRQLVETTELFNRIPEEQAGFRYAEGKWSVKQALGHVTDTERIFAYRALRIGRGDKTALAGFDQDVLAAGAPYDEIPLAVAVHEFETVRASTLFLLRGFREDAWKRVGTSDNHAITTLAIAVAIAGHELHHREIIRTRYLPAMA